VLTTEVPGVVAWVAWDRISVSPSRVNRVPRVVVNDEIPIYAVTRPLNRPTSIATSSAAIIAGMSGKPTPALNL
jgi:hypothetical protein